MIDGLIANSGPGIKITPRYEQKKIFLDEFDLVCHHNLANTAMSRRRWLRGGARLERLLGHPIPSLYTSDQARIQAITARRGPKIIGGIRGYNGLVKARNILKYFDAVHVNNTDLKKRVIEAGARQAFVLYPGVDLDLFKPMPDLRPDTFTVGWVGDVTKSVKNAHLINRLGYNFKMATKEHFIPYDQMPEFYNSLDVFVSFSTSEGWGRGIMEAMACGLPVVCSKAGASEIVGREWVVPGDPRGNKWLPQMRSRLKILKLFPTLRVDVGAQNRIAVEPWGWPTIAKSFKAICEKVVNG
jgi:glycosyltransferase involved in cell wall biosynthesis